MIEGQRVGREGVPTVLAGELIAQENVEPREGRSPRQGHESFQGNHAWNRHIPGWGANPLLVFADYIHPTEEYGLDGVLP